MAIRRYDYSGLRAAALETRTPEALAALAQWCSLYGNCWNGCCWDIDDGYSLIPVYSEPDEDGDVEIISYDIR